MPTPNPDTTRHCCECMCVGCERNRTRFFAQRAALQGDASAAERLSGPVFKILSSQRVTHHRPKPCTTTVRFQHARNPATLNWIFAGFSAVWRWAAEMGFIPESAITPLRGLFIKIREGCRDYLSREEVGQLLAYAEDHAPDLYRMIATAVFTGLRKGELYGLRWSDVVLTDTALTMRVARSYSTTKSDKARSVPIHPELAPILRAWRSRCPATAAGLVFPVVKRGGARMGMREDGDELFALLRAAGCHTPEHPWHALRHTFASPTS